MVWPVAVLAFVGFGFLVSLGMPLQRHLQSWLENDLLWSREAAQWPPILLGIPLFLMFVVGLLLIVRVCAIAFKAIEKGGL